MVIKVINSEGGGYYSKRCLNRRLIEFVIERVKQLNDKKQQINIIYFITGRYEMAHPSQLESLFKYLLLEKIEPKSYDVVCTSVAIQNFLEATGLKEIPFVVIQSDAKVYGIKESYARVKTYEETLSKQLAEIIFPKQLEERLKDPEKLLPKTPAVAVENVDLLCDNSTKNSLYTLAFDDIQKRFPEATGFHFCATDDIENICGALSHLPLPEKFSLDIFLVKYAAHGYEYTAISPVPRHLFGVVDIHSSEEKPIESKATPIGIFHKKQIERIVRDKFVSLSSSPTDKIVIENLSDATRYLKENHLVLPDGIICEAAEVFLQGGERIKDSDMTHYASFIIDDDKLGEVLKEKTKKQLEIQFQKRKAEARQRMFGPKSKEQLAAEQKSWAHSALLCG